MCFLSNIRADYDRIISSGEYVGGLNWHSGSLLVDGGGVLLLEVGNSSYIEVRSTSIPVNDNWLGYGIRDLYLFNSSQLLFSGGTTRVVAIGNNATSILKGGSITYLKSMQFTETLGVGPHIELYCQPGYSWIENNPMLGIQGNWMDGSPFRIEFINDSTYDPVYTNINVIIPDPATLLLFGLGGLLIRRKK